MVAAETQGLTKHYGHSRRGPIRGSVVRALEDLSIEVREGEIFGFLGPNGAGKSTLIRLLLGFLHPTAGSGAVLGLDIVTQSVEIRRRVGYLPGGIALYDGMSGEALLDYLARLYDRPAPLRAELVERLELSERTLRRPVRDYSRGMRQKIGIIQALQHDPELAILDEPTEGLDPLMQRVFYDLLDERRLAGRTIFFSSHVLSEVERVCDRVAFVRRGHLVALQEVDALLAHRQRNVEMRLYGPAPDLAGVPGVSNLVVRDGLLVCQLEGDVGPFLTAIEGAPIADLTIEPAHLEEAFLELYADDEIDDEEGEDNLRLTPGVAVAEAIETHSAGVEETGTPSELAEPAVLEVEPAAPEPEPAAPAPEPEIPEPAPDGPEPEPVAPEPVPDMPEPALPPIVAAGAIAVARAAPEPATKAQIEPAPTPAAPALPPVPPVAPEPPPPAAPVPAPAAPPSAAATPAPEPVRGARPIPGRPARPPARPSIKRASKRR